MHTRILDCPMEATINVIGNKWKPLLVYHLLSGTMRFGELKKSIPDISQKVLTDNLRSMEEDGLITREIFAEVPTRVEYSLTTIGRELHDTIREMQSWGIKYKTTTAHSAD